MNRRQFLATSAAALAASSLFYPSNARGQAPDNVPNILFIHTDQMSILDSVAAWGAPHVLTPGIDRLVRNGTSFMQSYSTDPVCCPARAAWWTGTYPSENGIVVNETPCHADTPNLSPLLQEAGYNTYFAGKWHVPGKDVRKLFHVLHEGSWWGEITDPEVTRSGRAFLRQYNDKKPFFLAVGYLNPHDICITPSSDANRAAAVPGDKGSRYHMEGILDSNDVPPLTTAHEYDHREPSIYVSMHRGDLNRPARSDWNSNLWRMHRYNYHRLVEMVDAEIELLLTELAQSRWRDNTLIVFTSDHGEGMGRHWGVGKSTFYDEVARVPFIVATLGNVLPVAKDVRNEQHLISGIDFGKTVCDYAHADGDKLPQGHSLRPIVAGETPKQWRDYLYAENSFYAHMITDGRYKYVRGYEENGEVTGVPPAFYSHPVGVEQLFDLRQDPDEQCNLAYDNEHQTRLNQLRDVMNRLENERLPLRPVTHQTGVDFITRNTENIRRRGYPRSYPVT